MLCITTQPLTAGRALEDGKGSLADGTQFDRQSGEEHGPNGYWFRWHRLKGKSGKVSSNNNIAKHSVRALYGISPNQNQHERSLHIWKGMIACATASLSLMTGCSMK